MPEPKNKKLYEEVKDEIYKKHPKHSAYRSGLLVKEYKARGGEYIGKKNDEKGLGKWFREKWVNQRGEVGYKKKSDIYRPSVRVNKDTPTTHKELTATQIKKAQKEKKTKGRVKKFDT